MSDQREVSYADKHDICQIRVGEMYDQVILGFRHKIPLAFVGPAGIGKTSIVQQACDELSKELGVKVENRIFMLSQKLPEDVSGIPYPVDDPATGEKVVQMLRLSELPRKGHGILFFDEMNQADQSVLRAVFQLINERRIGDYYLPDGYSIVACMNPDDENYGTGSPSPALRRRLSWMEVLFDAMAFLDYATKNDWDETLVNFLRRNREMILNESALRNNKIFACPASWEKVNKLVKGLRSNDRVSALLPIGSGLVGKAFFVKFMKFFEKHGSKINPVDVMDKYATSKKLQEQVKRQLDKGATDVIAEVCSALVTFMLQFDFKQDNHTNALVEKANNIGKFFVDINDDAAICFLKDFRKNFDEQKMQMEKAEWLHHISQVDDSRAKIIRLMQTVNNIAQEVALARI